MHAFRVLLVILFSFIFTYTAVVAANHGLGLLGIFFSNIADIGWPGQFNVDFMSYLTLSAVWLAWRHHFSPAGLVLGVLGFFGGGLVFTAYLFFASVAAKGDMHELLLGKIRAGSPAAAG